MPSLSRSLGLVPLTFYGIGIIVGAGIYSVIGAAAGMAGYSLWISIALAAIAAGLSALSYAELSTIMPRAGAEYEYLNKALPRQRWLASMVGIVTAWSGITTAATVSLAFAGYFRVFVESPVIVAAFALICLCTTLNIIGIRESSWVNMLFTTIEISGLLIIIWAGAQSEDFGARLMQVEVEPSALLGAAALIFFIFLGFEDIANLAEESRDPEKNLPRALLTSLAITTVLYITLAIAVVALLEPSRLAESESPLADAAASYSTRLRPVLTAIALFATANTALISMIVSSRVLFSMARNNDLPKPLSRLLETRNTPWIAALIVFALASALLPLGDLKVVAGLSSFAALLAFAAVNLALIVLRFRSPNVKRSFTIPMRIGKLPILPVFAIFAVLALAIQFDAQVYLIGGIALAVGGIVYLIHRRMRE